MTVRAVVIIVAALIAAGCTPRLGPDEAGTLEGSVVSGPTCPTEPAERSPSPGCEDQPVPGATIVVLTPDGQEVTQVTADAAGSFRVELKPGAYRIAPQPVDGLLGTPDESRATIIAGESITLAPLRYDTGIR